jgi:hypothetical protein
MGLQPRKDYVSYTSPSSRQTEHDKPNREATRWVDDIGKEHN